MDDKMLFPSNRLLCLDGGGIYGYFTVLMLKAMAEKHKHFLSKGHTTAFAGTSAGALISLLLAREEHPREALLNGSIEAFFKSGLLHGNQLDPVQALTSLFGLTTWCGGRDMERLLREKFGDLTLGDLPNKVLIMTFDMSGSSKYRGSDQRRSGRWTTKVFHNFHVQGSDMDAPAWFVAYGAACPATIRPVMEGITDGGIFAMSPTMGAISQLIYIAKVKLHLMSLYLSKAAATYGIVPPKEGGTPENAMEALYGKLLREGPDMEKYVGHLRFLCDMLEDFQEKQLISPKDKLLAQKHLDPDAVRGLSGLPLLKRMLLNHKMELTFIRLLVGVVDNPLADFNLQTLIEEHEATNITSAAQALEVLRGLHDDIRGYIDQHLTTPHPHLSLLNNITALSLGVGSFVPSYARPDFNLGFANFNLFPTNPSQNVWSPPALHMLYSPSTDHTDYEATQLLGDNYYRCNPEVINWPVPPVVTGLYLARFKMFRDYILAGIDNAFHRAGDDLEAAMAWMEHTGWTSAQSAHDADLPAPVAEALAAPLLPPLPPPPTLPRPARRRPFR